MKLDPHKILGIDKNASMEEIRRAYRKLAAKHHPDQGGDGWAFLMVKEAYRILCKKHERSSSSSQSDSSEDQPVSEKAAQGSKSKTSNSDQWPEEPFEQPYKFADEPKSADRPPNRQSSYYAPPKFTKQQTRQWVKWPLAIGIAISIFVLSGVGVAIFFVLSRPNDQLAINSQPKQVEPPPPIPSPTPGQTPEDPPADAVDLRGKWKLISANTSGNLPKEYPLEFEIQNNGEFRLDANRVGEIKEVGSQVELSYLNKHAPQLNWKVNGGLCFANNAMTVWDGKTINLYCQESAYNLIKNVSFSDFACDLTDGFDQCEFKTAIDGLDSVLYGAEVFMDEQKRICGINSVFVNPIGERSEKLVGKKTESATSIGFSDGRQIVLIKCFVKRGELRGMEFFGFSMNDPNDLEELASVGENWGPFICVGDRGAIIGFCSLDGDGLRGVATVSNSPTNVPKNLLGTKGFDSWFVYGTNVSHDNSHGFDDRNSIKFSIPNQNFSHNRITQNVSLSPGTQYRLTVWVQLLHLERNPKADSNGIGVFVNYLPKQTSALLSHVSGKWQKLTLYFDSGQSRQVEIALGAEGISTGTFWFDRCCLQEIGPSQNTVTDNKAKDPPSNKTGPTRPLQNRPSINAPNGG